MYIKQTLVGYTDKQCIILATLLYFIQVGAVFLTVSPRKQTLEIHPYHPLGYQTILIDFLGLYTYVY